MPASGIACAVLIPPATMDAVLLCATQLMLASTKGWFTAWLPEPVTGFGAPLLSMENTETLLEPLLATNRKLPALSVAT